VGPAWRVGSTRARRPGQLPTMWSGGVPTSAAIATARARLSCRTQGRGEAADGVAELVSGALRRLRRSQHHLGGGGLEVLKGIDDGGERGRPNGHGISSSGGSMPRRRATAARRKRRLLRPGGLGLAAPAGRRSSLGGRSRPRCRADPGGQAGRVSTPNMGRGRRIIPVHRVASRSGHPRAPLAVPCVRRHDEAEHRPHGYRRRQDVTLIEATAERAVIPRAADAVVIFRVHDVMRSDAALRNVFACANPGARVLAVGVKWAPRWLLPLNLAVRVRTRRVTTTREGFEQPWDPMMSHVPDLKVHSVALGAHYVAHGTVPTDRAERQRPPSEPARDKTEARPRHRWRGPVKLL